MKPSLLRRGRRRARWHLPALFLLSYSVASCSAVPEVQGQAKAGVETATQDRMDDPQWWPTKGSYARADFIGSNACVSCHADEFKIYSTTPMSHAGSRVQESNELRRFLPLLLVTDPYSYSIASSNKEILYTVSNGTQRADEKLAWAFGSDELGQTYLYETSGTWYESRLSLYRQLGKLDVTTGHSRLPPESLSEALGRSMEEGSAKQCFGCHTTAATTSGHLDSTLAEEGVACEACHGPGARHVAAMRKSGQHAQTEITNPETMNPVDSVDFCGACHRTWADVAFADVKSRGLEVVRFQPYRLEKSRCWGAAGDERITCIACHNPHQPLVRSETAYDARCLACHRQHGEDSTLGKSASGCPRSTSKCASCHMPKYTLADMHGEFTDHFIRVVQPGAGFPQ